MGNFYSIHIKKKIDAFNDAMASVASVNAHRKLFGEMVNEIFGLGGKVGFDLHHIHYSSRPEDHDRVFRFLHPLGPFFKLCYILCNGSTIYDFPFSDTPFGMQQEIMNQTCSNYYRLKMRINPETKKVVSLIFNPFEFYLFHFICHLMSYRENALANTFKTDKRCEALKKATLYMRLCEEYIRFFIPCKLEEFAQGGSLRNQSVPHAPPAISWNPSLIRHNASNTVLEACFETKNSSTIWRSYVFFLMAIDIWVGIPRNVAQEECSYIPSLENVCIVRYLVKHFYTFCNTCSDLKMDSFKREIFSLLGHKMYYFIKTAIIHWPYDATFSVIIETWLTFIQPWRYVTLSPHIVEVDRKWIPFIRENFIFYTYIFQLVLSHLRNEDLSMHRNVCMLIRPLKIYVITGLGKLVEDIEVHYLNEMGSSLKTRKFAEMHSHFCQYEGTSFVYTPFFDRVFSNEIGIIFENLSVARKIMLKKTSSNLNRLRNMIWLLGKEDEDSILLTRLTSAMQLLSTLFKFQLQDDSVEDSSSVHSFRSTPLNDLHIMENVIMFSSVSRINYSGDPELLPVQSFEIKVLVRLLYQLSSWINNKYPDIISSLHSSRGYVGKLAGQFILKPTNVTYLDKSRGTFHPELISIQLPPRLSLRTFAKKKHVINSLVFIILCLLFDVTFINAFLYLVAICFVYFCCCPLIPY